MLSSGKRILIFNGQNDFSVNTAGVLSYLQNVEWPGAKEWRESKK
jgi:carboxypeptidase C (cathepsin A)